MGLPELTYIHWRFEFKSVKKIHINSIYPLTINSTMLLCFCRVILALAIDNEAFKTGLSEKFLRCQ